MRTRVFAVLAAGCLASEGWAQVPLGGDFQVNTYTTGTQSSPVVIFDSSGRFVVAWNSFGLDGSGSGVFARRFSSSGVPEGAIEFRVNTVTIGSQTLPDASATSGGGFVVAWEGSGAQDGTGVFGQRYDASLLPAGGEFRVNAYTTGVQMNPAVTAGAGGGFVVAWSGDGAVGTGRDVFAQRFDAMGAPLAGSFIVNTYTPFGQEGPVLASDPTGGFVVAWTDAFQDLSGAGVFARRFDAAGTPLGNEFRVHVFGTGDQYVRDLAVGPSGDFVVVWTSGEDGSATGVFARRFAADGTPQGGAFAVNQYTTGQQTEPRVAMDAQGDFVVAWASFAQDGSSFGIFGRAFDASGTALGGEFAVNVFTTNAQQSPDVSIAPGGRFVVAWWGYDQDGSGAGVFARRFASERIFRDGFASASLAAWSSASTDGGDLSVSAAAALNFTTAGLQALVDDTAGLFVQDDAPDDENRYRARFYFDPNGFDPGEAQNRFRTRIFIAFEDGPRRLLAVVLRRIGGAYALMARARQDDNFQVNTPFVPIGDAPHVVEVEWRRSSGPDALDGSLQMWIDGVSVATLAGLDNSISAVDFVRMGALSVKAGANGTMYWDEFESRRVTYIGP